MARRHMVVAVMAAELTEPRKQSEIFGMRGREIIMSIQVTPLRWIEESEARQMCELAELARTEATQGALAAVEPVRPAAGERLRAYLRGERSTRVSRRQATPGGEG